MSRAAGFTLLEMLAVLGLLGTFMVFAATAWTSVNRAASQAARLDQRLDEVRASQGFLRQALSQALPLAPEGTAADGNASFSGAPQAVTFFAPLPSSLGGGLYRQHLEVSNGRLTARFAPFNERQVGAYGDTQVLLSGIEQAAFRYQGYGPDHQPSAWLDHWPWPGRLPNAVRVQLRISGPVPWVTEQVNLRLDLSSDGGL
jgi:general secretion pathway protein J